MLSPEIAPPYFPEIETPFDANHYLNSYPDVAAAGVDPEVHFRELGRREGRFPTEKSLDSAILVIERSGRFDTAYYLRHCKISGNAIRDYLLRGDDAGCSPNRSFDRTFFASYYRHSIGMGERPFVVYCRYHNRKWCVDHKDALSIDSEMIADSPLFDEQYFRTACRDLPADVDGATYYLTEGYRRLVSPSKNFGTRAYLENHKDIVQSEICPLLHYLRNGQSEGRQPLGSADLFSARGASKHINGKKTIIIVTHEASLSGAPIVGLNLARHLGSTYNIISVLLRPGALVESFAAVSQEVIVAGDSNGAFAALLENLFARHDITCAVLNSVECTKILPFLVERCVPTISLLHEFAQYVWPFNLFGRAIALSDRVLFPAEIVKAHAQRELEELGFPARSPINVAIRPQGRPVVPVVKSDGRALSSAVERLRQQIEARSDPEQPFVVLGAGWVQPRKGVDLFVDIARVLINDHKVNALFVWVGPNYKPRSDMQHSVYVLDQLLKSDLTDRVIFFDEQADLRPFYDVSDAFMLSSRLDPYPNVAVEAVSEGLPVICFAGATGIADLARWPDYVTAVPYNDVGAAARRLAEIAHAARREPARPRDMPAELRDVLSFERYAHDIGAEIEQAPARRKRRQGLKDGLLASGAFDAELMRRSLPSWLGGPLFGANEDALGEIASILAANEMPIGLVRSDRSTVAASPEDWLDANLSVIDPDERVGDRSLAVRGLVAFVETSEDVERLAAVCFSAPSLVSILAISRDLRPDDLLPVERILGHAALRRCGRHQAEVQSEVGSLFDRVGPNAVVKIVFDMAVQTSIDYQTVAALNNIGLPHRLAGDVPDLLLLSSLTNESRKDPFVGDQPRPMISTDIGSLPLAHRLTDCRVIFFSTADSTGKARSVGRLSAIPGRIASTDVWTELAAPGGWMASGSWALIDSADPEPDHDASFAFL